MYRFFMAVVQVFAKEYLREPNATDTARQLSVKEPRGFPGMLLEAYIACTGNGGTRTTHNQL
jgi:hypothetical protein